MNEVIFIGGKNGVFCLKTKQKFHLTHLSVLLILFMSGVSYKLSADESSSAFNDTKKVIRALYIPLADHYTALAAYEHLNVVKAGIEKIMSLAIEGGILKQTVNIDEFYDMRFLSAGRPGCKQ